MESIAVTIPKTPYLLCDSKLVNALIPLLLCKISSGLFVLMEFLIVKTVTGNNLLPSVVLKISERIDKLAKIVFVHKIQSMIRRQFIIDQLSAVATFDIALIVNLNVIFSFCREINGEKKNFCLVTNPRKKLKYRMFTGAES